MHRIMRFPHILSIKLFLHELSVLLVSSVTEKEQDLQW